MSLNKIKRVSLAQQVADKLEKAIEQNKYKIGSKIPTEPELMKKFDVSRNTLREAIQNLASAGLLKVVQGDGTYVVSNNRFDATMSMKLEHAKYADVNDARKALEVSIAIYAANRRTDEELEKIKEALIKRQTLDSNVKEHTIADIDFHMEIAESCHNPVIKDLYKSLYSFLIENIEHRKSKTSLTNEEIDEFHNQLYLAIESKDEEKAKLYSRKILDI